MSPEPLAIFVYGTLKQGEVRERCWPRPPVSVESATACGALYDLGSYPALVEGQDTVAGELWTLEPADMQATLAALDRVEGFAGQPDDWYRRVVIECQTDTAVVRAWTYRFAQPDRLHDQQRIAPNNQGVCVWSGNPPITDD